jgi:hypothetical protein
MPAARLSEEWVRLLNLGTFSRGYVMMTKKLFRCCWWPQIWDKRKCWFSIRGPVVQNKILVKSPGFCPGFSECRVFSAGMKIVIDKNLENTVWQCF